MQDDYIKQILNLQDKKITIDKVEINNEIHIYIHKDREFSSLKNRILYTNDQDRTFKI